MTIALSTALAFVTLLLAYVLRRYYLAAKQFKLALAALDEITTQIREANLTTQQAAVLVEPEGWDEQDAAHRAGSLQ